MAACVALGATALAQAAASASSVGAVGVATTSTAGNASTTWTVTFTTSASGALSAGGTITLTYPTAFIVAASPKVTFTTGFSGCTTATGSAGSGTLVVTLPSGCSLAASTQGVFSVPVTNPPAPQTFSTSQYTLATSVDTTSFAATSAPTSITASGTAVSSLAVTGAATANTAASLTYAFTTSASGALAAGDVVTALVPAGYTIESGLGATLGGAFTCTGTSVAITYAAGPPQEVDVTVPSGCSLADSSSGSLLFSDVTPPATTSLVATDYALYTSEDAGLTSASSAPTTFAPSGSLVTAVSASSSSSSANAAATWTIGFTDSFTGTLQAGDTVTAAIPFSLTGISATPTVTLASGFSCAPSAVTASFAAGSLVTTLPSGCSLSGSTAATFSFAATNPPASVPVSAAEFSVETSEDASGAVAATSVTPTSFSPTGSAVTAVSFVPGSATANRSESMSVTFTSSASGALAPQDTITVHLPADVVLSPATSQVTSSSLGAGCTLPLNSLISSNTITAYLGPNCSLGDSATATLTISNVQNPPATSNDSAASYQVATSEDPTAVSPSSAPVFQPSGSTVSSVGVSPGNTFPNSTSSWAVGFTTSAQGNLVAGDTVSVEYPNALTLASPPQVTFGGGFSCAGTAVTAVVTTNVASGENEFTVTLPSGCTLGAAGTSAQATISLTITSPGAQTLAASSFEVWTSEDPTPAPAGSGVVIALPSATFGLSVTDATSGTSTYTYGDSITLTVADTVDSPAPTGTGAIMYSTDGGVTWVSPPACSGLTLSSGSMHCTTTELPAGPLEIAYGYSGDGNYAPVLGAPTVVGAPFVDPATLTMTIGDTTDPVGTAYAPNVILSGLKNGDQALVTAFTLTFAGITGTTYGSSTTLPTGPGTYSLTPSSPVLSFTTGSALNYVVALVAGTLTIVAPPPAGGGGASASVGTTPQATLSVAVPSTHGTVGSSVDLSTEGGSGSGAVTFSVVGGTATGCAITGTTLSATGPGTCVVEATKAGDATYAGATSVPVTITFGAAKVVRHHPIALPRPVTVAFAAGSSTLSPAARRALVALIKHLHPGATVTITTWGDPRSLALARARAVHAFLIHFRHLHVRVIAIASAADRVRVVTSRQ
ncbi:MAG TPA: hypothetical protein PLS29_03660 [Acidimicrobiales bacterium]|nr:hypothetical protein [Acidimicrobiales bacterium]